MLIPDRIYFQVQVSDHPVQPSVLCLQLLDGLKCHPVQGPVWRLCRSPAGANGGGAYMILQMEVPECFYKKWVIQNVLEKPVNYLINYIPISE